MDKIYKAALIGCGDYLRWEIEKLNSCNYFKVKSCYDLDKEKAERIANVLSVTSVENDDHIFNDPEIDVVLIFTPPWVRKEIFEKAVVNKKHIITTKPLAPNLEDAKSLLEMVQGKVNCSVFYGRTGNATVEKLKEVFNEGTIGKLAIYKEDWFHHYPTWNNWATDPQKNGGPFMDAMVHNLNKARYLIGSKVEQIDYKSNNFAQRLACNDTESMTLSFANGSMAELFITWAADLEIFDPTGNDREHIGISHLITDKGWYVTEEEIDGEVYIKAKKEKEVKTWKVEELPLNPYDDFVVSLHQNKAQKFDIADALIDIEILERAMVND